MSQFEPYYHDDFDEPGNRQDEPRRDDRRYGGAPPARTSGMSLASLICGLMFCPPLVPSLFAVVFGVIGLRETRSRPVGGRGYAVTGLVLGVVGIAGWLLVSAFAYIVWTIYSEQKVKAESVSSALLRDLADGKVDAANAHCLPAVGRATLAAASQAMKPWGPFNSFSGNYQPLRGPADGSFRWDVDGEAIFSRGSCTIRMMLTPDGTTYRVERFEWKPGG
jgi:hypothetical protein